MTATLPFQTAPSISTVEIGDTRCGILRFPRYGSLLWAERAAISAVDAEQDPFRRVAGLALEISEAEGMEPADAFGLVSKILGAGQELTMEERSIRLRHKDRIHAFAVEAMNRGEQRKVALVTAGIRYRLPSCEDWTEGDTQKLPEALIDAIAAFLGQEEARMNEAEPVTPEQSAAELSQALGKSPQEPTADPPTPTGPLSSGASSEPIQGTIDSPPIDSPSSPSPSSVVPSKRRTSRTGRPSTRRSAPSLL